MATNTLVIACEVLRNQIETLGKIDYNIVYLKQGLHRSPSLLHQNIQDTINKNKDYDVFLLAYGLCSNAIIGIKSSPFQTIVVPKIDDCIGISMGTRKKYYNEFGNNPGTYYFTKGWIEADSDPLKDYYACIPRHGEETALWAARESIKHYSRACLIKTKGENINDIEYVRNFAEFFNLKYEEIEGSLDYLKKLLYGSWDNDFVIVKNGREITFMLFQ